MSKKKKIKTGDKPNLGIYECVRCNNSIAIDSMQQIIPVCPNCNHNEFTKLDEKQDDSDSNHEMPTNQDIVV